jgi:hypothetical protein
VDRIKEYLKALDRELAHGKTTEHTHRPALKEFVEALGKVLATNEPGREKCGTPDYVVTKTGPVTVGYIETKDVGKPLGDAEKLEQLQRYRRSLPNLILTDYLEFRWYVNGERRKAAVLVLLGHKRTLSCRIVLWDHASPRQAHKRNASRHIWTAWRTPRGT